MTRAVRVACVVVSFAWAQSAIAEPSVKDLAARTELHPIETLALTVRQFLTGDKNGKAVTIAGQLRFPQDVSAAPIRQFHGAADDYTPVAPCRAYFERLRAAGRDVLLTENPGAYP